MPRYRFNIRDGSGTIEDEEGLELSGTEAARDEAIRGARSLICDDVMQGRLNLRGRVEVLEAEGALLFAVSFAEAAGMPER